MVGACSSAELDPHSLDFSLLNVDAVLLRRDHHHRRVIHPSHSHLGGTVDRGDDLSAQRIAAPETNFCPEAIKAGAVDAHNTKELCPGRGWMPRPNLTVAA